MLVRESAKVPTTGIDEDAVELEGKVSLVKEVGGGMHAPLAFGRAPLGTLVSLGSGFTAVAPSIGS